MLNLILGHLFLAIKFEYSEKAAKFCKISTLLLFTVHTDKSKVKILQNFVAFSEYMNFKKRSFTQDHFKHGIRMPKDTKCAESAAPMPQFSSFGPKTFGVCWI